MPDQLQTLKKFPFFLFLLPLFFVLHGFVEYYRLVPLSEAAGLLLLYWSIAAAVALGFKLLFRSWRKAALAVILLLFFEFFFGNVHDMIKTLAPVSWLQKYVVLIPLMLALFIGWVFYLKRATTDFSRIAKYLNWLLFFLIFIDLGRLGWKAATRKPVVVQKDQQLRACDSCAQPDIYLIVADEYPGKEELSAVFSYDNTAFEHALQERGFHVIHHSRSNYNWTPYSLSSTLNMQYLQLKTTVINMNDLLSCEDAIKASPVIRFFQQNGYTLYNHSIFPILNQPSPLQPVFLSPRKRLITSPTLTDRFEKDLGFHFKSPAQLDKIMKTYLYNNLTADSLTRSIAVAKKGEKKFVYTHLMLPHHPYFFDSTGRPNQAAVQNDTDKLNKNDFLNYLVYSNRKILSLIDHIQKTSSRPPAILLLSDHGFRQFTDTANRQLCFSNLNAVFLPDRPANGFYNGMSNVNAFRVLLNTYFGQHLPMLKDSSVYLWEK